MRNDNPVEQFASSVYSALHRDLPDRQVEARAAFGPDRTFTRRPVASELGINAWVQQWGSTALGFDHVIAGAAMSSALTVVITCDKHTLVYFGGQLAYSVDGSDVISSPFLNALQTDIENHCVADQREAVQKYGAKLPSTK